MARPAARKSDYCTGHGPWPPRLPIEASPNVFVNGIAASRKDDAWNVHCVGSSCHGGSNKKGSSSVFINGKDAMRQGDPVDCGSFISQGSNNVFIG